MSVKFKISVLFLILTINLIICTDNSNISPNEEFDIESRIAGGYRPEQHTLAKYVVSIRRQQESKENFGYTHFCAGSILQQNVIITAAHCLVENGKYRKPSSLKVVSKTPVRLLKTKYTQEIKVKRVIVHSSYNDQILFNDIALLILKNNIDLDNQLAANISLPRANIKEGLICTVVGWGKLYMFGPLANEILYANLTLRGRKYCRKRYPHFSGKKLCALDEQDNQRDACVGDSGGPLICNGVLTGIVSYGYGCAYGTAGIYTNVFKYIDWIARGHVNAIKSLTVLHIVTLAVINIYV